MKQELLKKIEDKSLVIGVCGLGYVGLPFAVNAAKHGYRTIGLDVQRDKIALVNSGKNYIRDIVDEDLSKMVSSDLLSATDDFTEVEHIDFIAICVPTPLDGHQQPNLGYIKDSTYAIAKCLKKNSIVVLESTTYPGTTEEFVKPILEKESGLKCGKDFYLAFSPERIDPGNCCYKTHNTPKVVGAIGEEAGDIVSAVYRAILESEVYSVSSPAVAEMEKILENTYRNVNIGLINEMAMLCHRMNIDIWEVIDAAKTKPYGFQAFYPGPGLGGHCIPLDPYYLSWKSREYSFHTSMIEASMMINDRMPEYTVERAGKILNRVKKPLNGSRILVLGAAYKQDIDDYRESPALHVMTEFRKNGAMVDYYDPFVPRYSEAGDWHESIKALTESEIKKYDLVCITTAHTNIDYELVCSCGVPVFDCRNATKMIADRHNVETL